MSGYVTVNRLLVEDFEALRRAIPTSASEVIQVDKGRMRGSLTHISIGDLCLSAGSFSLGVCTRGVLSDSKFTFGMLLEASDRVQNLCGEMNPGDIGMLPAGMEHYCRYHGKTSFAAISVGVAELASFTQVEPRLSDPAIWRDRRLVRAAPNQSMAATKRMGTIISWISEHGHALSTEATEFWKRSLLEFVTKGLAGDASTVDRQRIPSATTLVRKVEDHLRFAGNRPIHISEICETLCVSRRTLHRAFDEVLGVAPATFFRHKRLCSVHGILRDGNPAETTVAEVAMQQGFFELGRFSHYYHSLFGEYPSETLSGRWPRAHRTAARHFEKLPA